MDYEKYYDIMDTVQEAYEAGFLEPDLDLPENLADDAWSCEDVCQRCKNRFCPDYYSSTGWMQGYDDKGEPIIVNCPMCDYRRK